MTTDTDTADASEAFLDQCRPKLRELETIRLEKLKVFAFRKKIAAPIAVIMTPLLGYIDYWLLLLQRGSDEGAAGLSVAGLAGLWGWVTSPKRQYAKASNMPKPTRKTSCPILPACLATLPMMLRVKFLWRR